MYEGNLDYERVTFCNNYILRYASTKYTAYCKLLDLTYKLTTMFFVELRSMLSRYKNRYSISSKILNIGRYIATMMPPTMPPTTTIIRGSIMEVSALTAASTSDS